MEQTIFTCDVATCRKKVEKKEGLKRAVVLNKAYQLCPECMKKMEEFAAQFLENGVDTQKDMDDAFRRAMEDYYRQYPVAATDRWIAPSTDAWVVPAEEYTITLTGDTAAPYGEGVAAPHNPLAPFNNQSIYGIPITFSGLRY